MTESFIVEPSITTINIPFVNTAESGYIEEGVMVRNTSSIFAGDTPDNNMVRGFISYDITGLADTTVLAAWLSFEPSFIAGTPFFSDLWVGAVEWGHGSLIVSDYSLAGVGIESFNTPDFVCSSEKLKTELQKAIDNGRARFQVRIHFVKTTSDGNSFQDGWGYEKDEIEFKVTYSEQ